MIVIIQDATTILIRHENFYNNISIKNYAYVE